MRTKRTASMITLILTSLFAHVASAGAPLGSGFTYQGKLNLSGSPVNDAGDFEFTLWDDPGAGSQIGSTVAVDNVTVVDGVFTVELDFGAGSFDGDERWLEIAVRSPAGGGKYTTLSPRQPVTATPYALQTRGIFVDDAGKVGIGTSSPNTKLNVREDSDNNATVHIDSGQTVAQHSSIRFSDRGTAMWGAGKDPSNNLFIDEAGVSRRVTVQAGTGHVGIGTSGPTTELDVVGTVTATSFVGDGSGLTNVAGDDLGNHTATASISLNGNHLSGDGDGEGVFVADDGSVGIGTMDPGGALHVAERIRMGSETGTTTGPSFGLGNNYRGIVTRRIISKDRTDGDVVARTDTLRLERDGTDGGLKISWDASPGSSQMVTGTMVTRSGNISTQVPIYDLIGNPNTAGSTQIADDTARAVFIHIIFGNQFNGDYHAEVTLFREPNDYWWMGNVHSSWDQ